MPTLLLIDFPTVIKSEQMQHLNRTKFKVTLDLNRKKIK